LCVTHSEKLSEVQADESITGFFAPAYVVIKDLLHYRFPNISIVVPPADYRDVSDPTSIFQGCLESLSRNESDIGSPFFKYPVMYPGVKQPSGFSVTSVMISSSYKNMADKIDTDAMDCFYGFNRDLWYATILTLSLLSFLVMIAFWMKMWSNFVFRSLHHYHRICKVPWRGMAQRSLFHTSNVTICYIVKQMSSFNYKSKRTSEKVILQVLDVFFFFIMFYFTSFIKTDMVVQKQPRTITSYDDILEYKVIPRWTAFMDDYKEFSESPPGSKERLIWQWANEIGLDNCMMKTDEQMNQNAQQISTQESVWLASSFFVVISARNFCPLMRIIDPQTDSNAMNTIPDSAKEYLVGYPYSSSMPPLEGGKFFELSRKLAEAGLDKYILSSMEYQLAPYRADKGTIECLANTVILPDIEMQKVDPKHYKHLFQVSAVLILVCVYVLAMESYYKVLMK
jgi:hypothetical protein